MFKYYKLKDGTGEIAVTSGRILPQVGAKVRVKGKGPGSVFFWEFTGNRLRGNRAVTG